MKATGCDLANLGARIEAARKSLGLSRPAAATLFGCSVRSIENNEWGKNEPGACLIASLAGAGINANWLLTGEGPMLLDPAAELGRLMAEARGVAPIQQLAENMDVQAVNLLDIERGRKIADAETIHDYVRLCGADPGLLFAARDRALVACGLLSAPTKPSEPPAPINVKALSAIIEGLSKAGCPTDKIGQTATRFYLDAIEQRLITPTGIGDGGEKAA